MEMDKLKVRLRVRHRRLRISVRITMIHLWEESCIGLVLACLTLIFFFYTGWICLLMFTHLPAYLASPPLPRAKLPPI
jgi:hypothetical protein